MIGDRLSKTYYEVITVMPRRSIDRKPNFWDKYVRQSLRGHEEASPLGLLLTIETDDKQEAFRLRDLIFSYHSRWERSEGGGVSAVYIFETQMAKRSRHVSDDEEATAIGHADSMWKRLPALAAGVKFSQDWVEEDLREELRTLPPADFGEQGDEAVAERQRAEDPVPLRRPAGAGITLLDMIRDAGTKAPDDGAS
jgi:hypothetical protein